MTDEQTKAASAFADNVIFSALELMQDRGVPFDLMMDRILTAAGAHIARHEGAERTSAIFRKMAVNIDAGALVAVERRTTAN